jgi:hypothetical protein
LSGSASIATYQSALDSVAYIFNPTNGDPTSGGADTSRTISWAVNDGTASSATATSTLDTIHVAPTVTAGGSAIYHVGDVSDLLDPGLAVSDSDSGGTLVQAIVDIASGYLAGDTLNFTNQNGITGSYNGSTELTLSGTASLADYQAALESVSYSFTGGDPTNGGSDTSRTIQWTVSDAAATSAPDTSTLTTSDVPCFCRGTGILTSRGEVAVEHLALGDLIVTLAGKLRPIQWIGFGRALVTPRNRCDVSPVIVRRGALGDNVPHRDLHVTRRHSLLLKNILVPVEHLINGASVCWDDTAQVVEYYHIELDAHDVLLANGAPAESFRDDDSRHLFQNEVCRPPRDVPAPPCAPVVDEGPLLERAWWTVASRLEGIPGEQFTRDPDLHLLVDGRRVNPVFAAAGVVRFSIDRPAGPVSLVSRNCIPQANGEGPDRRRLGVGVTAMTLVHTDGDRIVPLDSEELSAGFHDHEGHVRWTKGRATLPASLFAGISERVDIELRLAETLLYRREVDPAGPLPATASAWLAGRREDRPRLRA